MRDSPSASAAATKSRSTTVTAEPRTTRAMRGTVEMPTVRMISVLLAPNMEITTQGEDDLREGEMTVHRPHQHVVELAAVVRRDQADDRAEHQRERGGENRGDQDRLAAVEEAGPDVAAELAGTEQ